MKIKATINLLSIVINASLDFLEPPSIKLLQNKVSRVYGIRYKSIKRRKIKLVASYNKNRNHKLNKVKLDLDFQLLIKINIHLN